jgi:hypothetical protein
MQKVSILNVKFQYPLPGLLVRLWPLSCEGMGSIPIQEASIHERMSTLYTLVWGSGPSCHVYEAMFEKFQNFPCHIT